MKELVVAASSLALLIAGCSSVNEGMTDVRRLDAAGWQLAVPPANTTPIGPNETVLITLQQMYLHDFGEMKFQPDRLLSGGDVFIPRGEIAVLVGAPDDKGPSSFASSEGHLVVFYSNDVVRNQFLNFRNQRVFGPAVMAGDRFEIEFLVLELDRTSNDDAKLIESLAELGKTYAGVPGPALDVLTQLGSSLLTAESDDVEMRYRMTFDLGSNRPTARLPLYPGYYAMVREDRPGVDDRSPSQRFTDWNQLCLNQEDGRLYNGSGPSCGADHKELYLKRTYLTIHVERGVPATTQAMVSLATLGTQLAETPNASAQAVNATIEAFQSRQALEARERAIWDAFSAMESAAAQYGSLQRQCPNGDTTAARSGLLRRSVELHRRLTAEAAKVATPPTAESYDGVVYEQQIERLVDFFIQLHWAESGQEATLLAQSKDPAHFATVFGTAAEFARRVQDRADQVWPVNQCTPPTPNETGR